MHLLERYALSCGLKIDKPMIMRHPFPLPFQKYITVHNSSGAKAKNYSYYNEVLKELRAILPKDIVFVQIGQQGDQVLHECYNICGKTNIYEAAYVVENAILHIGNDSVFAHIAGALNVPSIICYSNNIVSCVRPFWANNKTVLLESHRNGNKPSFSLEDPEANIDLITVESVVNATAQILDAQPTSIKTIKAYHRFKETVIEVVPDFVLDAQEINNQPVNLRMDYFFHEENMQKIVSSRQCSIATDKPFDLAKILPFKKNILGIIVDLTHNSCKDFVNQIKRAGIKYSLVTRSKDNFADLKFEYFYHNPVILVENFGREEVIDKITQDTKFRTNKFIVSNTKLYTSKEHWLRGISVPSFRDNEQNVIDTPSFWEDIEFYWIFNR